MALLIIPHFKYGLDARKSELESVLGTLASATNGHVNAGGAFEKRFGFVPFKKLPTGCFGLGVKDNALCTFGSAARPAALDVAIGYQQLVHPYDSDILASTGTLTITKNMDAVKFVRSFQGAPFVAATFSGDTRVYLYYDGDIIESCRNGIVLAGYTSITNLANDLARQVMATPNFFVRANQAADTNATVAGQDIIKSAALVHFNPVITVNSAGGGDLTAVLLDQDSAEAGTGHEDDPANVLVRVAQLEVTGVASQPFGMSYALGNVLDTVGRNLTTGNIPIEGFTLAQIAADIISRWSAFNVAYTGGWKASAGSTSVKVLFTAPANVPYKFVRLDAYTSNTGNLDFTWSVITTGAFGAVMLPSEVNVKVRGIASRRVIGHVLVTPQGGTAPYTYLWEAADNPDTIVLGGTTLASTSFYKYLSSNTSVTGLFKCTISDSALQTAVAYVNVTLSLTRPTEGDHRPRS